MTPHDLIAAFETLSEAPGGVKRLRELVLQLAVSGRLVAPSKSEGFTHRKAYLAEVATILNGFAFKSEWYINDGVRLVRNQNVSHGSIEWEDVKCVGAKHALEFDRFALNSGDILLSLDRPLISTGLKLARVRDVDLPCLLLQRVACVRSIDPSIISSDYLFLWFRSPDFVDRIDPGRSNGVPHISTREIERITLRVPPLAEQHRIVARVDELMGLLDRLEAARNVREATRGALREAALAALRNADTLDEVEVAWRRIAERMDDLFTDPAAVNPLRQAVLQLAVRGKLVPQDPADEPASVLMERCAKARARLLADDGVRQQKALLPVSEAELRFTLPAQWEQTRIDNCFYVSGGLQKSGKRRPTWNSFPYLRVANVQRGRLDLSEIAEFELFEGELERLRLEEGDLLVVEGNGSEAEIGRCARWNGEIANCVHQNHLIRCRALESGLEHFVLLFLNAPEGVEIMKTLAVTTSGLYNLSVGRIRNVSVPVPPLAEQRRIVAKVDELMSLLDRLEERLKTQRDLQDAFAAAAVHHLDA